MNQDNNKRDLSTIGLTIEQERLVIRRFIIYSILVTFFYTLQAVIKLIDEPSTAYYYSLFSTILLIGIFAIYFLIKNHAVAKNYITIVFSLTAVLSFFSFNGLTGLFTIDLINILIFTFILFNGHSLLRYGLSYLAIFCGLICFQIFVDIEMPEVVVYFNTEIDSLLFVVSRLILTINMIFYLKYRHNVERFNLIQRNLQFEKVNNQLTDANQELLSQNKEVIRQKKKIDEQNAKLKKIRLELEETNNSLEERILARTEELISVNEKLKKTLADLDRFVYSASHDLSAPLKSILGLVQIAKLENKDKLLHDHFNHIERSINKQEIVINNLIQFSRNSRNEPMETQVDLDFLLKEMVNELKYYPGFNTVDVNIDLSVVQVVGDEARLSMILNNLLSNAIKYQDAGKKRSFIKISTKTHENFWSLTVTDNGQGINEEEIDKIFTMFYRANEQSDGSGLGLFIVAEAVEKMNGTIKVTSKLGEGSTFTVNFPLKVD